jgi:hypothetical protein
MADDFAALTAVMQLYFDGLHHSDTARLRRVFHPKAVYATATEGHLTHLGMEAYFAVVDARPSPASRGEARADRIVSISFAGPVTALVRAECAIGTKAFQDLLTFVKLDGEWRLIAKVFHFDVRELAAA